MKLSLILPSYSRRELTERAVRSILAQDFSGAEIFFFGDHCGVYSGIVTSEWFVAGAVAAAERLTFRLRNHEVRDGTPTRIINEAIAEATGEYVLFMANDDRIAPNHFASYYDFAKANDADLTHTNSTIEIGSSTSIRDTSLDYGRVGHAEICVRAALAKGVPPHHRGYGHDWDFIRAVVAASRSEKILKSPNAPTYVVNMGPREHVYQNGTL